ncbi:hypothetical protein BH09PSE6_BH09PSE6_24650 [soil metagenome]
MISVHIQRLRRAALPACAALLAATALSACTSDPLIAAAGERDAVKLPSGVVYKSGREGWGPTPRYDDRVRVKYRGYFPDGRDFDRSPQEGAELNVDRVIVCWTEVLQRMRVGGQATITCPAKTAYGEKGAGNGTIPADAVLRFDIELLAIATPR